MTAPTSVESSEVSLLVPHAARIAVLVEGEPTSSGHARLPSLTVPTAEPSVAAILAAVDFMDTDAAVVLRQVMTSGPEEGGSGDDTPVTLVVEFDARPIEPPSGWRWLELDEQEISRLEPESARAAVGSWAKERAEGWSPLRPAWSRPGWFTRASAWMREQLEADGRAPVGRPRQHQLWGLSVVLRASTHDGDVWFKCSPEIFRQEAVMTQALAVRMPDRAPQVIAVDASEGWLLMRDLGAAELGEQDESLWSEGVTAHAGLQQLWLGRTDELTELGLPDRPLSQLTAQVEEMVDDDVVLGPMSSELRKRWRAAAPALAESCRRLDELGPGPTLVHGDFHPWNVVHGTAGTRVFDWTDAAVSHPFVDLATYVFRTQDVDVRRQMVDACVAAWSEFSPAESLREATSLGLVVGALYQVQTYRSLLPTLVAHGADDGMAGADLSWIKRSLTRHELGLESRL